MYKCSLLLFLESLMIFTQLRCNKGFEVCFLKFEFPSGLALILVRMEDNGAEELVY